MTDLENALAEYDRRANALLRRYQIAMAAISVLPWAVIIGLLWLLP